MIDPDHPPLLSSGARFNFLLNVIDNMYQNDYWRTYRASEQPGGTVLQ